MSQNEHVARIILDGSQPEAELLKLARAAGTMNQAIANSIRAGLQPLARAMDEAIKKSNLETTVLGKGASAQRVASREITNALKNRLTPERQARIEALRLFDAYKKLSESAVKPTSRALLSLADAFEKATPVHGISPQLFKDAAEQLRMMEALPAKARNALNAKLAEERHAAAEERQLERQRLADIRRSEADIARERKRAQRAEERRIEQADKLKARLMTNNVDLQDKGTAQRRKMDEAEARRDNAASYAISRGVISDRRRKEQSRRQLGAAGQGLQNRLQATGFANFPKFKDGLRAANQVFQNAEATKTEYDEAKFAVQALGRELGSILAMQTRLRNVVAEEAREIRGATRERRQQGAETAAKERKARLDAREEHRKASMPEHSIATEKALLKVASASQGVMLAQSLLQRQVIGVGFSLIFARSALLKWMAAAAAATLVISGAAGLTMAFLGLAKAAGAAGVEFEKSGQQLANFYQSGDKAEKLMKQASELARAYGITREEATKLVHTLESIGINQDVYRMADLNASAAGIGAPGEFAQRLKDITKADADVRGEMTRQLAKDYSIPIKKYASSLEIATAVNKRFAGSAERSGDTAYAAINRIKQGWIDFKLIMGSVVNEFLKPMLEPILAFVDGMTQGFQAARDAGIASGSLHKQTQSFAQTMRKLVPYMAYFGYVLGTILYKALIRTAQVIKIVADTLIRLWNKMKPVVDFIRAFIQVAKEMLDKLVSWFMRNKEIILTLIGLAAALIGLPRLFAAVINMILLMITGLENLAKAILGLPKAIVDFITNGFKEAMEAVDRLKAKLAEIKDKFFKIFADDSGINLDKIKDYNDQLSKIPQTVHTDITNTGPGAIAIPTGDMKTGGKVASDDWLGAFKANLHLLFPGILFSLQPLIARLVPLIFTPIGGIVALVLVSAIVAGLIIAFPKETGTIAGIIAGTFVNILALLPGLIITAIIRAVAVIVGIMAAQFELQFRVLYGIFKIPFDALVNLAENTATNIANIISRLFSGDWEGALRAGGNLLKDIFITPWTDMGIGIKDFSIELRDIILPEFFDDLWNNIKGPSGMGKLIEKAKEPVEEWAGKFADGFSDGWDKSVHPKLNEFFGKAWQGIVDAFGNGDNYGMLNALKVGLTNLVNIGNSIGNPFTKLGRSVEWIGQKLMDFLDWLRDNAHNLNPANWIGGAISRIGVPSWNYGGLDYAMGGVVPGRRGTKQLVTAEAGEVFLGSPAVAQSSGRLNGLGSGGDVHIYIPISDSVITNSESMTELTDQIASKLVQRMGIARNLTFHRV